jgi:hypothetical protein
LKIRYGRKVGVARLHGGKARVCGEGQVQLSETVAESWPSRRDPRGDGGQIGISESEGGARDLSSGPVLGMPEGWQVDLFGTFDRRQVSEIVEAFGRRKISEPFEGFGSGQVGESVPRFGSRQVPEVVEAFGLGQLPESFDGLWTRPLPESANLGGG